MIIKKQNYVLCVIVGNKTFKITIFTLICGCMWKIPGVKYLLFASYLYKNDTPAVFHNYRELCEFALITYPSYVLSDIRC